MDRDRLKDVHATDLTESRVNEDFVDWLKNKGPTWLLVFMVPIVGYLLWGNYQRAKQGKEDTAWAAYVQAQLPESYAEVATDYGAIDRLDMLSWLAAAKTRLRAVQSGLGLSALAAGPGQLGTSDRLTDEQRTQFLANADELYGNVIAADDGSDDAVILVVAAMNGRAAVAECRGDAEDAKQWYEQAADRAGDRYPGLAGHARTLAETCGTYVTAVPLVSQEEAQALLTAPRPGRTFVEVEPALEAIIEPETPDDA